MRLSRTGWNNVIIFAMLLMIFLFNGLHHKLIQSDSPDLIQPIFPVNSFVLTLAYPEMKIERVGTSWRATDLIKTSQPKQSIEQLDDLILMWQQAEAPLVEDISHFQAVLKQQGADSAVTVWFAGQSNASVFQLIHIDSQPYLFDQFQQRWLVLEPLLASQLFPFMSVKSDA